jgi:hypothetical protein
MSTKQRFPDDILAIIRDGKILSLRAGTQPHRFIGIWAVVVEGRVFVRSWSLNPVVAKSVVAPPGKRFATCASLAVRPCP